MCENSYCSNSVQWPVTAAGQLWIWPCASGDMLSTCYETATMDIAGTDPPLSWGHHPFFGEYRNKSHNGLTWQSSVNGVTLPECLPNAEVLLWTKQLRFLLWEVVESVIASDKFGLQSLLEFPYLSILIKG